MDTFACLMPYILYFLISLGATAIGAMTGMGGGVIIKPLLDALGSLEAADIGILSSVTVFSMALVSAGRQMHCMACGEKTAVDLKIAVPLAIGSLFGGGIGDRLLMAAIIALRANGLVVSVQNGCLALLVIAVFFYMRKGVDRPTLNMHGAAPAALAGICLGLISSFLGIGGGPVNVALILFIFSGGIKTATAYSLITILFAQTSKLVSVLFSGDFFAHDLSMLPVMVTGAVIGGWAGSMLNKKLPEKTVEKAFSSIQILIFLLCLSNIVRNLIP